MGTLERENYTKREKFEHDWEDGPNLGLVILLIISEFGIQHLRKNIAAGETSQVITPLTLTILTSSVSYSVSNTHQSHISQVSLPWVPDSLPSLLERPVTPNTKEA